MLNFYPAAVMALPWNLPQAITDNNSLIQYRYLVHGTPTSGTLKGLHGKAWLEGTVYRNVRADLLIPVPELSGVLGQLGDTFGLLVDSVELPAAHLILNRLVGLCSPQEVNKNGSCRATAEGNAQFGPDSQKVSFPITVIRDSHGYRIEGVDHFDPSQAQSAATNPLLAMIERAEVKFTLELPDSRG